MDLGKEKIVDGGDITLNGIGPLMEEIIQR
jgi:hypothetical protein